MKRKITKMVGWPMHRDKRSGHERVLAAVKHSLAEGRYEGGMLPSYRELVRNLNVTMASVRRAMAELEREGVIRREKGRGAFARPLRCAARADKPLPLKSISFLQRWISSIPSFVESDYLAGYTEALDYLDIRMRFIASNELDSRNKRLFSPILPVNAQGVVLLNVWPPELMKWLQDNGVPFVVQYHAEYAAENLPPHSKVYVNNSGGAAQAVNHLLSMGHRNIGFMGAVLPQERQNREVEGYRAALVCAGLDCTADRIVPCATKDRREIFAISKAFLSRPNRPTAILAGCDEFALSLLEAARALKLRVPDDLSIVGFDNRPGSEGSDPPLTTVSVPRRELAQESVNLLLEVAENPHLSPKTRILDTYLIIRESTAPPQSARPNSSTNAFREKP